MEIKNNRRRPGISFFSVHQTQAYSWFFLMAFILFLYVPFLGSRMVRPAGDDKVYTSQVVEMEQAETWFHQRLQKEHNYHKGPLHYILIKLGIRFFGYTMWATVWMNLLWVMIGSISIGALVHRHMREFDGWSFYAGASFALASAVYSHVFASQMEVGLASLFALGLYYLDRSGPGKGDLRFWVVCGIAGLLKSPLHAALLGSAGILFWIWQREFFPRLLSLQAWGAFLAGILTCIVPYLPAYLFDHDAFWYAYVLRETFHKPANGAPWHYPIIPLFTYGLMPWTMAALVTYADGISRLWRRGKDLRSTAGTRRLITLGICLCTPSVLFFLYHPYRGQNYNTPVISGLLVVIAAIWATRSETWSKYYNLAMFFTALLIMVVPAVLTYFIQHFSPMPFWWPNWLLPMLWVCSLLTARGLLMEGVTLNQARPGAMARRFIWFFLALGSLLAVLGEREMIDLKLRLSVARANGEELKLSYWNTHLNIWNEWGYLNFMIQTPVSELHTVDEVRSAIREHHLVLLPGEVFLQQFTELVKKEFPDYRLEIQTWRRWATKAKSQTGDPVWQEAWRRRDLSLLEHKFYMVRALPTTARP